MDLKRHILIWLVFFNVGFVFSQSWVQVNDTNLRGGAGSFGGKLGKKLLLGSNAGVFVSSNNGDFWQQKNNGIRPKDLTCNYLSVFNNEIYFVGSDKYDSVSFYKSSDTCNSWNRFIPSGIPVDSMPGGVSYMLLKNRIFGLNGPTLYTSTDFTNWSSFFYPGGFNNNVIKINDTILTLGIKSDASYIITMNDSLQKDSIIMPTGLYIYVAYLTMMGSDTCYMYILNTINGKIYRGNLNASPVTWQQTTQISGVSHMYISGRNLLAIKPGSSFNTLYRSSDYGSTFQIVPSTCGLPSIEFENFGSIYGDTILVNGADTRMYISYNGGLNWKDQSSGFLANGLQSIYNTPYGLFAQCVRYGPINGGILQSTDNGTSWQPAMNGIPSSPYSLNTSIMIPTAGFMFTIKDSLYYLTDESLKLYKYNGISWQYIYTFPMYGHGDVYAQNSIDGDENNTFINFLEYVGSIGQNHYYQTNDYGATWHDNLNIYKIDSCNLPDQPHYGRGLLKIKGTNDTLFTGRWFTSYNSQTYQPCYSTDTGTTWQALIPLTHKMSLDAEISAGNYYPVAGFGKKASIIMMSISYYQDTLNNNNAVPNDSLFLWKNGVWTKPLSNGLPSGINFKTIDYASSTWFLTSDMGVYQSTDDGDNWGLSNGRTESSSNVPNGVLISDFKQQNNVTILGTSNGGCWVNTLSSSVGINEFNSHSTIASKLTIFPNPTSDKFDVKLENNKELNYVLIDCYGKELSAGKLTVDNNTVYINNLTSGVYFIKANNGACAKVVVVKQ